MPVFLATSACLLALAGAQVWADAAKPAANHIIKWVDEKGTTHYSDGIPAQYSGRDNAEINGQGVVIKRNKTIQSAAENPAEELLKQKIFEQKRRDRSLLASYTTAQEIDLARERNLQLDEIAVQGLQQRKANENKRLIGYKKTLNDYLQRKTPPPLELTQSATDSQARISRIDQQIAQKLSTMEATRARFDKDKQRFIELKQGDNAPKNLNQPAQ